MDDASNSDDKTVLIKRSQLQYERAKLAALKAASKTHSASASAANDPIGYIDRTLHVLPLGAAGSGAIWVITLYVGNDRGDVIRVKVMGDVVLGLKRPRQQAPDLDLTEVEGESKGVSRRHAILHPALEALYLLPMPSTNGTRLNGVLVEAGKATALQHGDVISLGGLHLALGIEIAPDQPPM